MAQFLWRAFGPSDDTGSEKSDQIKFFVAQSYFKDKILYMCFSVEVKKEIDEVMRIFKGKKASYQSEYELLKERSFDLSFVKYSLELKRKPTTPFFKEPGPDNRIFPGYFTWIMVQENGQTFSRK